MLFQHESNEYSPLSVGVKSHALKRCPGSPARQRYFAGPTLLILPLHVLLYVLYRVNFNNLSVFIRMERVHSDDRRSLFMPHCLSKFYLEQTVEF